VPQELYEPIDRTRHCSSAVAASRRARLPRVPA
jgi:hypothetical protein